MKKRILCTGLLMVTVVFSAGAKELRFSIPGDPKTFDPLHLEEENSQTVSDLTSGKLLKINRVSGKVEPELAASWLVKEEGRTIVIRLRSGLQFSDGSALGAADVVRTLERALDRKEGSPLAGALRSADQNPEVSATGALDVTVRYKSPKPGIDRQFDQLGIVPRAGTGLPASAGPFFVAEYHPGQYLRLARNPHYWKRDSAGHPLPYLDSIRIDIQENHDIELSRFLRGESQIVSRLEPEGYDRLVKAKPGAARNLGASYDSEFFWFNQSPARTLPEWKRRWFTSTVFRRAISGAIHRDDIVRIVFRGYAHLGAGPISTANRFWFNSALKSRAADPEGSLKALAAEGFRLNGGVLRDRDGHAVEFSIITNSGNRVRERIAQLLQDDLAKIGVRVTVVPLDFGSLIQRIARSLDYDAAVLGFNNVEEDPAQEVNIWLSSGPQHPWWPAEKSPATPWEARIDELENKQISEISRDARKKAIDEFQKIVAEQEPVIYLVNPDYLCAISPSLKGVQPTAAPPQIFWNVEWFRIE